MRLALSLLAATLALAAPALAQEPECHPAAGQTVRTVEELKADLAAKGWEVANVKTEEGCYEVYGTDAEGKKVEIFFDPVTFEQLGSDE